MRKVLIASLMAAGAVPLFAQAPAPQPPMSPMAPRAAMADKVVTRAEVQGMVQTQFVKMDSNRDGFLVREELRMGKMDRGPKVTERREMSDPAKAFDRLDANRDGMLSRDEFAKGRELRIERRVEMSGAPGKAGMQRMKDHRMGGHGMGMRGHMLKMADVNKDGRVSLQEATSGALQHFDKVDANRDGQVTPDERRAMRGMHRRRAG